MTTDGLTPGHEYLRDAAQSCFAAIYGNPTMHRDKPLSPRLDWRPGLRFVLHGHTNVFVEPSDSGPFPRMLAMRYGDVLGYPEPIAIYSVCSDTAIATGDGAKERRRLKSQGFGLVTVDAHGNADRLFPAIPIIQVIPEDAFKDQLKGLPRSIRQRASEAFEEYRGNPVGGVKSLSEVVEGMINKAGKDSASARGGISKSDSQKSTAGILEALHEKHRNARAAIGGARSFNTYCRNLAHHWPRTKRASRQKYQDCRHHFLVGLRTIQEFRSAMKNIGLSGNVLRV